MKPFILGLVYAIFLLTACSSTALVDFQDYQPEYVESLCDYASQNGVRLSLWGIDGFSKEALFLYGGLSTPGGSLRSVLLRSSDGGQHWKEVMQPEAGSEVTELVFLPDGLGWAAVMHTLEGPGRTFLYHSEDSGAHWQQISEFPLYGLGGHSFPSGLQFQDSQAGSVRIISIINLACCRYDTLDGGLTWQKTEDCLPERECLLETPSEVNLDQMSWKYSVLPGESAIKISRRVSVDGYWEEVSKIPLRYGYARGRIIVP